MEVYQEPHWDEFLPEDAYLQCNGRLFVNVTKWTSKGPELWVIRYTCTSIYVCMYVELNVHIFTIISDVFSSTNVFYFYFVLVFVVSSSIFVYTLTNINQIEYYIYPLCMYVY